MAIHFVGQKVLANKGSTEGSYSWCPPNHLNWPTSLNSGLTGGNSDHVRSGDFVVVVFCSGGNGYAPLRPLIKDQDDVEYNTLFWNWHVGISGPKTQMFVAWKFMGSTPDDIVKLSTSGDQAGGCVQYIYVFEGVDGAAPFDGVAPQISMSQAGVCDPPPITPLTHDAMILVAGGRIGGGNSLYPNPGGLGNYFNARGGDLYSTSLGVGHYHDWVYGSGPYNPNPFVLTPTVTSGFTTIAATMAIRTLGAVPGSGTGGGAGVWNGTARVNKPVKYWNGTSFVTKPLKFWNGTTWVTTP